MSDDKNPAGVEAQHVITEEQGPQSKTQQEQRKAVEEYGAKSGQFSMRVKVHSPFRDYFDGRAFSVSAVNATGPFDILPQHHNFISLLNPCDLIVRAVEQNDDRTIRISGGIMQVKADKVVVFLDV